MTNLIKAESVKKYFLAEKSGLLERLARKQRSYIKAVDGVTVDVIKNETTALVGESGSGKTTLGRMMVTLETPTEGKIHYDGLSIEKKNLDSVRKRLQIVFQNPYESLDPRMNIKQIIEEPLFRLSAAERLERVKESLEAVGLNYNDIYYRKARDISGGQRQRVAIARAIAPNPEFIMLDEPTSALDASVQSQVLNLLVDLKEKFNYTYLFITHNILVAKYISDEIYVMYAGKIIESGKTEDVFNNPMHPYTKLLLKSVPRLEPGVKLEPMVGEAPSLLNPPSGCRFNPRCPYAFDRCFKEEPPLIEIDGHKVACHLYTRH
ncbi:MAG: ABC transporter ATP-binding protein [Thermoprotei archaeon]